jgi:hypothetical protein
LPAKPTRLLQVLFHRLDSGAFYKGLLNADAKSVVYVKELPKEIQVRLYSSPKRYMESSSLTVSGPRRHRRAPRNRSPLPLTPSSPSRDCETPTPPGRNGLQRPLDLWHRRPSRDAPPVPMLHVHRGNGPPAEQPLLRPLQVLARL